ncbi:MAG TPA: TIGR04551 family protein [Myxococcota bacterium]|nr:TIGR04551 family protein [Myxococcota bacterium]
MVTKFLRYFVLLAASLTAMAENQESTSEAPIPELPPEVSKPEGDVLEKSDAANSVVNFETSGTTSRGTLNALDLAGYFRTRFSYFRNGHLGTYIPELKRGTSLMPPNLSLFNKSQSRSDEDSNENTINPTQHNYSANMRLRVNPTINVSEVVRVKGTVDVFDNLVLGSTPSYLAGRGMPNPSWPHSGMSLSQNAPMAGINTWQGAISVKRAWAEADFPIGELRFGRMPFHFGLGILYNSGNDITSDYGDQVDGISFTTRFFDHFVTPSYHIAYTGPVVRGGGFLNADNFPSYYLPGEAGQRRPLESGDLTHVFSLTYIRKESDFITAKKREEGRSIFNYGIFASYRRQFLDSQAYAVDGVDLDAQKNKLVKRDSHVGLGSLWGAFSYGTFHIEAEAAGIWGSYQIGEKNDSLAKNDDNSVLSKRNVWLLQGGVALESRYGFLSDRLQVGLNSGWASSQSGPGFGLREGSKNNPKPGEGDGRKLSEESKYKTNFRFNPAYTVDLLLYREVLGGISGTFYIKPHVSYFFSRNFGLRGDVISAIATDKSNTTGNSNWLGVEADASAFFRTDSGFYFQLAYGVLVPLKGLNHQALGDIDAQHLKHFGEAKVAQTLQAFIGVTF